MDCVGCVSEGASGEPTWSSFLPHPAGTDCPEAAQLQSHTFLGVGTGGGGRGTPAQACSGQLQPSLRGANQPNSASALFSLGAREDAGVDFWGAPESGGVFRAKPSSVVWEEEEKTVTWATRQTQLASWKAWLAKGHRGPLRFSFGCAGSKVGPFAGHSRLAAGWPARMQSGSPLLKSRPSWLLPAVGCSPACAAEAHFFLLAPTSCPVPWSSLPHHHHHHPSKGSDARLKCMHVVLPGLWAQLAKESPSGWHNAGGASCPARSLAAAFQGP